MGLLFKFVTDSLGLGASVAAAMITYATFYFLDRNASGPAKQAISEFIRSRGYREINLADGVISGFDRFYGPLAKFKTLLRVTCYAVIAGLLANAWYYEEEFFIRFAASVTNAYIRSAVLIGFAGNIISDYICLIIMRAILVYNRQRIFVGILLAALASIPTIVSVQIINGFIRYNTLDGHIDLLSYSILIYNSEINYSISILMMLWGPTFLVLFWLPAFGIGALLTRGINTFFMTVKAAQWFLKQGNRHPFRAIGLVISPVVFVVLTCVQLAY